ncbi:MAG TPA: Ppx/GppA phosphatase family protein [Gemmatimonadaceae bacterium]|jgi:exopolyphosphatase/guanosine-5'-triphosphate,3'-diphosphate pyrophosphatase|nr:Ppx/GppA phosphatase family protein [Gemmatimonadaceae bacterium]
MNDKRIAAIDIGSNSIRQIVADVSPTGEIRIVDEMKAAPRLGSGLTVTGRLDDAHMNVAAEALVRMATLARHLGAKQIEVVATSAVREAVNGGAFLARVRRETGLKARVLQGEEEARLAFRSALAHFELGRGRSVVMDIGGGSLELVLAAEGLVERLRSFPFGAVRLTEQFLTGRDGAFKKGVRKLRKVVRAAIRDALPVRDWRGAEVIGSGGTFTNLAGIFLAQQGVRVPSVHGTRIPQAEVEHILERLVEMDQEERLHVPGLNPGRADIIVAGLAVAAEVLARVEPRDVAASAYGIREGLLLETARVTPVIADRGQARERSVIAFAERCHYEEPHSKQVQRLSLQLFDALGSRIGCESSERQTLADAALLHDVGYHINYEDHHKHSFHLIRHADLLGMSPEEQVVIALVARYHRGAAPKRKHGDFWDLSVEARARVRRLSALLRVADGFDRGHVGAVDKLKVRWLARAIRVTPVAKRAKGNMRLELWGASRKSALLADVAGLQVEVVSPTGVVIQEVTGNR